MTESNYAPIIMPDDPAKVVAVQINKQWILNVYSDTVHINTDTVKFVARFNGKPRKFTVALEEISGWQEDE